MDKYTVGDIVQVRSDLSREERKMWPSFVPQMDVTMSHLYCVQSVDTGGTAYYLRVCDLDPTAESPCYWLYAEEWLLPAIAIEEAEDHLDDCILNDLVGM